MALSAVSGGMSTRKAAKKFDIGCGSLSKYKNKDPEDFSKQPQRNFTKDEEIKIAKWICMCAARGQTIYREDVFDAAYSMLKQRQGEKAFRPTSSWLKGFLERQNLSSRISPAVLVAITRLEKLPTRKERCKMRRDRLVAKQKQKIS